MNKSFTIFSEAWWPRHGVTLPDNTLDEILIGSAITEAIPQRDDDIRGEIAIRWTNLQGTTAIRLEIYSDSWKYFEAWPDLFKDLAQLTNTNITPTQLGEWLKERDFIDATPRDEPFIKP